MLHFQIDPQSGIPVYRQIMDQVKYYVASGTLRRGERLASVRELARLLKINPTTVVKAYSELAHEDVIEQKQGKGAFVTHSATRYSKKERERSLRRISRQLAVEAEQSCQICKSGFELRRPLERPPLEACPMCKSPVKKQISQVSTPKIEKPLSVSDAKSSGFTVLERRDKGVYEKL